MAQAPNGIVVLVVSTDRLAGCGICRYPNTITVSISSCSLECERLCSYSICYFLQLCFNFTERHEIYRSNILDSSICNSNELNQICIVNNTQFTLLTHFAQHFSSISLISRCQINKISLFNNEYRTGIISTPSSESITNIALVECSAVKLYSQTCIFISIRSYRNFALHTCLIPSACTCEKKIGSEVMNIAFIRCTCKIEKRSRRCPISISHPPLCPVQILTRSGTSVADGVPFDVIGTRRHLRQICNFRLHHSHTSEEQCEKHCNFFSHNKFC